METKLVALIMIVVAVSGCSQLPTNGNKDPSVENKQVAGKGLEVTSFRAVDNTLRPGQRTKVVLNLRNYHTSDISIINKTLINTGLLRASNRDCSPNNIRRAQKDLQPEMRCEWDVSVPSSVELSTEKKPQSMTLFLKYSSSLTLVNPLKLDFKQYSNVNSTSTVTRSFSNGEVRGQMTVETPATLQGRKVDFTVREVGSGRVTSKYTFDFFPQTPQVFYGCPEDEAKEPIVGKKLEFSCTVRTDSPTTKSLYFSTYYKYAKEPTLNINIVNN
ncbi:hypothetical protein GKQ38_05075 [Candidatus Nanohaloarchaea archaeon]|nr:hypothetical protein GKQ38_05075 [Candidatus Nanohaloarchaea archaeon]